MIKPISDVRESGIVTTNPQKKVVDFRISYGRFFFDNVDCKSFLNFDAETTEMNIEKLEQAAKGLKNPFVFYWSREATLETLDAALEAYGAELLILGNGLKKEIKSSIKENTIKPGWYAVENNTCCNNYTLQEHAKVLKENGSVLPQCLLALCYAGFYYFKNNEGPTGTSVVRTDTTFQYAEHSVDIGIRAEGRKLFVLPFLKNDSRMGIIPHFKKLQIK